MLLALGARIELASPGGTRVLGVDELILGHYDTAIEPDELVVRVHIPRPRAAAYVKFRSRSSEDRPCVAVAVARLADGEERVAVGAVSDRPLLLGEVADAELIADLRGSADYRRRMVDVHVRRARAMLDG
jgi:carbon-monoxide dehydrogenase medium subunit